MKKVLTIRKMNNLRKAIDKWAKNWDLNPSMYSIYMRGFRYVGGEPVEIIKPWEVCESYNENFIFGMSVDGDVYDAAHCTENYWNDANRKLHRIFNKYGLDFDFADSSHLTAYLLDESMEVEYQYGKTVSIEAHEPVTPKTIRDIMKKWEELATKVGDKGSCVIGAYLTFTYNGLKYRANTPRIFQGSLSWEKPLPVIRSLLSKAGAEHIVYHYGYLD